jgi:hypothetical protein
VVDLGALEAEYTNVEVVANLVNADSADMMNEWANPTPLDCVRTVPMEALLDDYMATISVLWNGYHGIPLIDLSTMTVLVEDCSYFTYAYEGVDTWRACIDAHITP